MADRLFVGVLGNQNTGKSTTWNDLFGRVVRRGKSSRMLELRPGECVEVYLVSGSFEERGEYAGDILTNQRAAIVLCSIQYTKEVADTLDYVNDQGFDVFIQWLNPGFHDSSTYFDSLGLANQLLADGATVAMRDGQIPTGTRVQEIREFIYGWAAFRNLIVPCS